jgi:hypothetical protein
MFILFASAVQDVVNKVRFVRLLGLGKRLTEAGLGLLTRGEQGWSAVDLEPASQVEFKKTYSYLPFKIVALLVFYVLFAHFLK